ncbi:helix-turn-helix domain-containing protein [Streptomyces sp. NBC_00654]|uniref:helix-turn-helix domain-containing protein n=1 Tax=Streptomyces sp. NBC_00654 TaxID=2975799 RepID=UPI00224CFAD4|nr:helix-turn-helix domain-containing protein [Streptomyces sp. NBC_00654]MCX4967566.1 helix-turn-helix domain-containing protein [Streptomyces sp. NBC_00654]
MAEQLGPLLRRLRTRSGLTQEQMAERSGVSVRTIRRLETGKSRDHRLGTLNLLADALEAGAEDRQRLAATLTSSRTVPAPATPEPAAHVLEAVEAPEAAPVLEAVDGRPSAQRAAAPAPAPVPLPSPLSVPVPVSGNERRASPNPGVLPTAADELAREIRRRWRREEEQRRVHDPFPLPVRWQYAPSSLTDHPENIQRLPSGATSPHLDLGGDLRNVAEVYRRIPSGRLIVLGRAGSGKSILTIRFVLDFLETRAPLDRVPVIFSVGSWDPTAVALRDWLIDRLVRDHPHLTRRAPGGSTLAAALVDADLVLPVLDGFDEIAEGLRRTALEALNTTSLPLVVTCRRGEFAEAVQEAGSPLVWAAGIELGDLTLDDLTVYLPRTARPVARGHGHSDGGASWDPVLRELRAREGGTEPALARVLSTPLMITLARTMYSEAPGSDPMELLDSERFPDAHSLEEHLLAGFVPTVYRHRAAERTADGRRSPERDWGAVRAERWLGHLAHHLARLDREQQDLAWWQIGNSLPLPTRVMTVVVASAVCVAVSEWLVALLFASYTIGEVLLLGSLMGSVAGLAFGSVYGLIASFGAEEFEPAQVRLRLPGTGGGVGRRPVRTFTARFGTVLLGGFVMGVGCACALVLQRRLYHGLPLVDDAVIKGMLINMLAFGLIFGAGAGLVFGLLAALEAPLDISSAATPAGLLSSNRATVRRQVLVLVPALTLAIALVGHLVTSLLQGVLGPMNWKVSDGLVIGSVGGVGGAFSYALSFTAWGRWVVLCRIWLPLTGKLPWDTAAFLDDAYRRGVLRRAGAVYQFRHIRLQHHLGRVFREQQSGYAPATFTRRG